LGWRRIDPLFKKAAGQHYALKLQFTPKYKNMKHLKIETILEKRIEKIDAAFHNVRQQLHPDDLRIFRVKVKKLGAFLHLTNAVKDHGRLIKLPQKMVKIYQLLGVVRALQLQQSQIQRIVNIHSVGSPETYLTYLADQIQEHAEEVNKHLKGLKPFKKEEEKLLKLLPEHLGKEAIIQFLRSEGDRLEKLFAPVFPSDKSFHEARRLLKNLLYISPYLPMEMNTISPYARLTSYEDIAGFTALLGDFHDLHTAIENLYAAIPKMKIDDNEKALLRNIEIWWMKEREDFRISIYDELQKITDAGRRAESPVEWPVM
jgi:hypothetical protein